MRQLIRRLARYVLAWDRDTEQRHSHGLTARVVGVNDHARPGDMLMAAWPLDVEPPGPGWHETQPGIAYRQADGTSADEVSPDMVRLTLRMGPLTRPTSWGWVPVDLTGVNPPTIPLRKGP